MSAGDVIYEGRTKILYETGDPAAIRMSYKDDVVAFRQRKHGILPKKGVWSNGISTRLFQLLESHGLPTHFLSKENDSDMRVRRLKMIPILVVIRNIAAGVLANRFRIPEGTPLEATVIELYYGNRLLHNPFINRTHIQALDLASMEDVDRMISLSRQVNEVLVPFLEIRGLVLVDFRLEFGLEGDRLAVADEITPDTCRIWDQATLISMDKDRFRQDLEQVAEAYEEVYNRVCLYEG